MRSVVLCMLAIVYSFGLARVAGQDAGTPARSIPFTVQTRDESDALKREVVAVDPGRTAIVVIDMWDRHWCETYTRRVGNLVPRMNATLAAARQLGMTIVFAPSDVADFYESAPQRQAMRSVPEHPEPARTVAEWPAPPPPTDHCECGPDEPCKEKVKVWTRQHPDLMIAEQDLIADCNNGRELLNLCAERNIDTLIYCGVASNMCVQYRSMGIRSMKGYGLRILVIADLVEAITSNGVDAAGGKNLNFTPAAGTARVQRHLERYLASTFESRQLLQAARGTAAPVDARPQVVFISAEREYDSRRTLPEFAKKYLADAYRCTFLEASGEEGTGRDDIPGLDALYDADCLVLYARRRSLPVVQMDHLERYLRSGRPLVALRTSVVAFQTRSDPQHGYVVWDRFDQEVIGSNYRGYNPRARDTGSDVWTVPAAAEHPLLQGVAASFHSPMWIYYQAPLSDSTTVLLKGRWSTEEAEEPVAWTNVRDGSRVFYTSLGHPGDFQNESFNRLLQNAVKWAVEGQ